MNVVMAMEDVKKPYVCIKEDKIAELDAEITFKQKRLDDIDHKIERMDEKLDKLNENMNKIIIASNQSDNNIEKRLVALETKTNENEKAVQDNRNRFTLIISAITIFFTALTFIFNFILR